MLDLYRKDLKKFSIIFFKGIMTEESPPFHEEIFRLLQTQDRIAIAAPRGFAKSALCVVIYPIWLALLGIKKDICIISASETLAAEFMRKIKIELETNQLIRRAFGDVKNDAKWTETHIILNNGVNIRAKGAGGQIRGFRPDCILIDDFETDESCESEEQRKKLKEWLFKACLNTLLPGGQMVIIGTLIHPLSVLSDLIETPRSGWERRRFRAYIDSIEEEGYELWPKARSHKWLQQRKSEIGSTAFAAEFLNNPRLDDSVPIKEEHIRYWSELPRQYSTIMSIDPAYADDKSSDYKVCMVVATDQRGNRYVVEYIRTHIPTGEFMDSTLNLYIKHKSSVIALGCPSSGTEKEFYRSLVNRASDRKIFPPFVELKNTFVSAETGQTTRNKKRRIIAALQPLFEQGKYYIHAEHQELRDELLTIGSSRWDDLVDACAYAESLVEPVYYDDNSQYDSWGSERIKEPQPFTGYNIEY